MSGSAESHAHQQKEQKTTHLWRIWRTVHEMLYDRGYQISESERTISRAAFAQAYDKTPDGVDRNSLRVLAHPSPEMIIRDTPLPTKSNPTPTTTAGVIWVEFCADQHVGVKQTRQFAQYLNEHQYTNGILITQDAPNAAALRAFDPLLDLGITARSFQEVDLLVNITKHELVPKHVLLSESEKKVLLDRYRLKETQLPRIQLKDPVAWYLGLKNRQVVKIIRKSETAGRYASYRWVYG